MVTRVYLATKYNRQYRWLLENKPDILDKLFPKNNKQKHSVESVSELIKKYKYLKDFRIENMGAYSWALSTKNHTLMRNLLKKIEHGKWTELSIHKVAKEVISLSQLNKKYPGAYEKAVKLGIISDIKIYYKKRTTQGYYTLDVCMKISQKYNSVKEWREIDINSYSAAKRKGFLELCCRHMPKLKGYKKEVVNLVTGQIFESITLADLSLQKYKGCVFESIRYNREVDGCFWAYVK